MSDNHDLLNDKDVCSFEEHEAENVCSNKDAVAYRDNSCTTSDRFVNWTAASETYQRKSNIFIIQQNKINEKDRSFSRKIESEWSFFIPLKRIFIMTF